VPVPKALLTYRTIAERYPSQAEDALWKLGTMYENLDRHALAAQSLVDLTTRFPETQYDAWFKLAELYEKRLRDRARAAAAYAKVPTTSQKYSDAQKKVRQLASER
jgi:TolA-binding protein